ncbi:AraC family transcriptional regulator [Aureibaculum sp. 2210JD6-5]|uniref:helix-turn-helix domain-containing protein n=1 Tax=Aureibaculum sp. 2210JD6-5 TaxID=3103957 RepID=UPI002AAE90C7|nr:AraC family transcriptional regulator [Aureibaculum sp. 2210JD6-5]MDY7394427.1 AraC family transcriptional regulator [Aureibaculum sp. 2210JD6-5]
MTISKMVKIIFLFIYVSSFSLNFEDQNLNYSKEKKLIDSLYFGYNQSPVNQQNAQKIIETYNNKNKSDSILSAEDLKILAISYSHLNNSTKASHYVEKYIKKSHDLKILDNDSFEKIFESDEYQHTIGKYRPKLNVWILFFFATGLIGVFISIVLNLRKKGDITANILISLFVLMHSLFMINLCLFLSNYVYNFPNLFSITLSFSFLYGPLLYFYYKRISQRYIFKPLDILHLLPTLILLLFLLPNYLLTAEEKLHILLNRNSIFHSTLVIVIIIKSISLIGYGYLVFRLYHKNFNKKSKPRTEILKWQRNLMILNSAYALVYAAYGVFLIFKSAFVFIYPQTFLLSITVLYVGYIAYVQPSVFSKKHLFYDVLKYQKSGLTESFSNELKGQLLKLLYEEKIYKINNISLEILSERLETNRHSASQVINEHFNMNFFNLINKFRIQEAVEIFKNDKNNNLNIIDVAYDVGYNNKVTFNKAFKDVTGTTPSQFINNFNENKPNTIFKVNFK